MPGLDEVIKARAEEGEEAIEEAKRYMEKLRERLGAISAATFGNYARGEFNLWSDIDVIVAPQKFKDVDFIRKCLAPLDAPPKIEAICWTPEEAAKALKALVDRGPQKLHNPPRRLRRIHHVPDAGQLGRYCDTAGKTPVATFAQTAAT